MLDRCNITPIRAHLARRARAGPPLAAAPADRSPCPASAPCCPAMRNADACARASSTGRAAR